MAVFRIERTRDYTVMSNHHLRNANLSLKAKGLLSMMLSLPEDWNYTTRGLAKICKEGVDAIGAALRELEAAGYIVRHKLFYPQLGVKLCSMAGGGVQKIYMVFLREPSRRDRSGSDLFHLRDGFEIKMNFDRNVSCFIFVNALMHDDFFD